jgi:phosphopantothenoylcysteine decarboxylase
VSGPPSAHRRVLYLVVCAAPPAQRIGELVALLVERHWTVCVIATPRAAGWLDTAALIRQTGFPVRQDYKQPGGADPLPKADAIAVVPATFNTINKWVAGISDTFALGLLNEAIGLRLPVVAVPHAKSTLAAHPTFNKSLRKLRRWRVRVLPNEVLRRRPIVRGDPAGFDWLPVVAALEHPPRKGTRLLFSPSRSSTPTASA